MAAKTLILTEAENVRRWERSTADVPVRVVVQREKMVVIVDGKGKSLSDGGMSMFAGTELRPGNRVAVEFTPPYAARPIRLDATICTRKGYSYGLEFLADIQNQAAADEFRRQLAVMRTKK